MKRIEIPSGMKDMIGKEAANKFSLQRKIEDIFLKSGYEMIMTPDIEFYQTYLTAYTNVKEEEMYQFFDHDGKILTLREDMTVPIARVAASKYMGVEPPFRFCYTQNVYKVRQAFAGKRNEVTDCGVELIGADDKSDPEILVTALEVMESLGVNNYTLEIGNSDFFRLACRKADITEDDMLILADLVDRKSMVDLREKLNEMELSKEMDCFFEKLPMMSGKQDALQEAYDLCFDEELKDEVKRMQGLEQFLSSLGYTKHISFDLSKVPHLDYYTGIIFEGFIEGVGSAVLSGGRYDALLKKFGRDLPACGFGVKIDPIAEIVTFEEEKVTEVRYPASLLKEALECARTLRKNECVKLVEDESVKEIEVIR